MARRTQLRDDISERRRLEDESPRLLTLVPRLVAMRLELSESRGEGNVQASHIKRIALDHAPSVFMIPCGEPRCRQGSYDLTDTILRGLRTGIQCIEATDTWIGDVGTAQCGRVLHCVAVAEYAPA